MMTKRFYVLLITTKWLSDPALDSDVFRIPRTLDSRMIPQSSLALEALYSVLVAF